MIRYGRASDEGEGGIKENNWTLVPSKYIEFVDHDLEIDYPKEMARIQQEMKELMHREKESQKMLEEAFRGIEYIYVRQSIRSKKKSLSR